MSGYEEANLVQYEVNRSVNRLSSLFLAIWVVALGAMPLLLASRSKYWFLPLPFMVYHSIWSAHIATYPKRVALGTGGASFEMLSGKDLAVPEDQLKVQELKGVYAIEFTQGKVTRKLRVVKRELPQELEERLNTLAQ